MNTRSRIAGCLAGLALAACSADAPEPAFAERWLGRWSGPEGTWLDLQSGGNGYTVTIRNLDGERSFAGSATGDGIRFERDREVFELAATDGDGTGMKWLAGKSDCLVIQPGEGFCRD